MINKIIHISDVHIFQSKRHEEHNEVINNLKKLLLEEKPDLIYCGGDIIDSKAKMSAEQIELAKLFFYSCANIAPMVCILGNHDLNLQNKGLDSLSPIISNLQTTHPIYLLKDTGVYTLYDIDWAVWSVLDNKNPFKEFDYKKQRYTIGCFHGPVEGCQTESGWKKFNHKLPIETFKDCNIVMLGDIHKTSYFRNNEIVMAGSLIQTKVDEDYNRGVIVWNWSEKEKKHIPSFKQIFNSFGYKTFEINDLDKFDVKKINFPSEKFIGRILYVGDENNFSELKFREIKKELKENFPNNIITQKRFNKFKTVEKETNKINSTDFFEEYFKGLKIDKTVVKELKSLDKSFEKEINITDYQTGKYVIEEVIIHNFACYGANNVISFSEMNGLIGLFNRNGTGKTTLFYAIMFCLFNKTPKTPISLINDQLNPIEEAYVQVTIRVNGIRWRVKRKIIPKKNEDSAQIRVEVYEEINGKEEPKHLESRPQTDSQLLRPMLGDDKTFLITTLASQKNSSEFVDKTNSDRLDLVIKFLGISIYDEKHSLVNDELKMEEVKYNNLLTEFEKIKTKEELNKEIKEFEIQKKDLIKQEEENNIKLKEYEVELKGVKEELKGLALTTVVDETEEELEENKIKIEEEIEEVEIEITNLNLEKSKLDKKVLTFEELKTQDILSWRPDLKKINDEKFKSKLKENEVNEIHKEIKNINKKVEEEKSKLTLEFCPTCNQKWQEVDKESVELKVNEFKEEIKEKENEIVLLEKEFEKIEDEVESLESINLQIESLKTLVENNTNSLKDNNSNLNDLKNKLKAVENNITSLKLNKNIIKLRNSLTDKEETLVENVDALKVVISETKQELTNVNKSITDLEESILEYNKKYDKVKEKENLVNNLKIYKKAMHRTGIPLLILNNFIPLINRELSIYLADLFDFNVEFQLNDNNLEVSYYYESLNILSKRDVERACGMEGTIINLAIRSALTKVSLLPKPSLLLLDEIFSMLDANHLDKMKELLLRLKEEFDNIIIISHLEELKDLPEYYIKLENKNGITNVV